MDKAQKGQAVLESPLFQSFLQRMRGIGAVESITPKAGETLKPNLKARIKERKDKRANK